MTRVQRNSLNRSGLFLSVITVLATSGVHTPASGQSQDWSIGLVRSATFAAGGPLSVVETARYESLEIDFTRPILIRETWRLEFPIGVIPLAWVRETALGPASVTSSGDRYRWSVPRESGRTTSRGYGVRAGGIRAVFGAGKIRLQGDVGVGILRFQIPTPASNASRVNLTGELGLGIQSQLSGAHFGVGYRLHHLSNAGRGPVHPGIDSHMFYLGLWIH